MNEIKPIGELLKIIKIKTRNPKLYERALTHSSYAYENNEKNNERLEFLGDSVIEILMSEYLFHKYKDGDEGLMTKKRAQAVCEEALFHYATQCELHNYLRLGKGESNKGASPAIIADSFEALFGALYLDQGYKTTRKIFNILILPNLNFVLDIKDFKSTLQEFVQLEKRTLTYKIVNESGPSHDKEFEAVVYLDGDIILGKGKGKTKKEAEQKAAEEALKKGTYKDVKTNL